MTSGDDRAPVYAPRVQVLLERLARADAAAADAAGPEEEPNVAAEAEPVAADGLHPELASLLDELADVDLEGGGVAVVDGLVWLSQVDWLDSATDLKAKDVGLDRDPLELPSGGPLLQSACVGGLVAAAGQAAGLRDVFAAAAGRIVVSLGPLPLDELLPVAALTIRTLKAETKVQQRIDAEQRLQLRQDELIQQSSSSRPRKRRLF
jgi:hypothetical protein